MIPAARLSPPALGGRGGVRPRGRTWIALACSAATLALLVSACGGAGAKTEVVRLRSANPVTSDLYVRIRGPAGAVGYLVRGLATGAFGDQAGGFFVPPAARHRACSFSHTIGPLDAPSLQAWRGRKVTITIFGKGASAVTYCLGLRTGVFLSRS